jgi:arginyl-tRNA synthetase
VCQFRYKYTDLSTDRINDYTFDYDRMLSFDGDTAPYLECVHVRIQSIFRKAGVKPQDATGPIVLEEPAEPALAMTLLEFEGLLREFEQSLDLHRLCGHLYGLATAFTSFYGHYPCCVLRPTLAPAGWRCGSSPLRPGCAAGSPVRRRD